MMLIGWADGYEPPATYDLVVPTTDGAGHKVLGIGPVAEGEESPWLGATSVFAPTVRYIFDGAFKNCDNITTIRLPAINHIYSNAFYNSNAVARVEMGPIEELDLDFADWEFYLSDGTTLINWRQPNPELDLMQNKIFTGTYLHLVDSGDL